MLSLLLLHGEVIRHYFFFVFGYCENVPAYGNGAIISSYLQTFCSLEQYFEYILLISELE